MKQFIVIEENDVLQLLYLDKNGSQIDYGELSDEPIIEDVKNIFDWLELMKTPEEQKVEELELVRQQALEFIQSTATDEQKLEMIDLFDEFQSDHEYKKGDEFKYEGKIYRVLQDHTSQQHWKPTEAVALYVDIENKLSIQEFEQPTGSTDAYQIGDKVLFNGKTYESIVNDNVWSPTDYPQGWMEI